LAIFSYKIIQVVISNKVFYHEGFNGKPSLGLTSKDKILLENQSILLSILNFLSKISSLPLFWATKIRVELKINSRHGSIYGT
jgi:hypothetical protein